MKIIKKIICIVCLFFMIPVIGCKSSFDESNTNLKENNSSINESYKLNIKDLNNIILNIDEICINDAYGLYNNGDEITFEIQFFLGCNVTLTIDGKEYIPTYDEAFAPGYIKYTMPAYDVDVISLKNNIIGDEVKLSETLDWGVYISDENLDYIDIQVKHIGVAPQYENGPQAHILNEDNYISTWFNNAMIRKQNEPTLCGGSGYVITFILKDTSSYVLTISNNYITINDTSYYLIGKLPSRITSLLVS